MLNGRIHPLSPAFLPSRSLSMRLSGHRFNGAHLKNRSVACFVFVSLRQHWGQHWEQQKRTIHDHRQNGSPLTLELKRRSTCVSPFRTPTIHLDPNHMTARSKSATQLRQAAVWHWRSHKDLCDFVVEMGTWTLPIPAKPILPTNHLDLVERKAGFIFLLHWVLWSTHE